MLFKNHIIISFSKSLKRKDHFFQLSFSTKLSFPCMQGTNIVVLGVAQAVYYVFVYALTIPPGQSECTAPFPCERS